MENFTKEEQEIISYLIYKVGVLKVQNSTAKVMQDIKKKISANEEEYREIEKKKVFRQQQGMLKIGRAATVAYWTDREGATIIYVSENKKKFTVQIDNAKLMNKNDLIWGVGGFAAHCEGNQEYEYTRDPNGRKHTFTLRKNGKWAELGCGMNEGPRVSIGHRSKHYDYNF